MSYPPHPDEPRGLHELDRAVLFVANRIVSLSPESQRGASGCHGSWSLRRGGPGRADVLGVLAGEAFGGPSDTGTGVPRSIARHGSGRGGWVSSRPTAAPRSAPGACSDYRYTSTRLAH